MSFDLTKCDPICIECIKNYSKKFGLKKGDTFKIKCSGIPLEYVTDELINSLQTDKESIECMINPIAWAAKFLDWHCLDPDGEIWKRKTDTGKLMGFPPYDETLAKSGKSVYHRPYQKILLDCSANRKVFRIGRQCIAEDTLISTNNDNSIRIQDIKIGDYVLTYNYFDEITELKQVYDVIDQGIKPTFRIKTENFSVICTSDHALFTENGWKSIQDGLKIGDFLLTEHLNWEEIEEIKYNKKQRVWDLSILDNHNFFANSILVKNCGKSTVLCILTLFNIFTNDHFTCQLIAPYQPQVDLFFKRVNDLIDQNPLLLNSVARRINKPPNTIELKNGSILIGFPAGVKTKQESGSSRGQCLAAGTKVLLANNELKNIEDIKVGDLVYSHHGWLSTQAKVTYIFEPREIEVYEIITKSGKKIEASAEHRFFNYAGEIELKNLNVGDQVKIHTPVNFEYFYIDVSLDQIISKKYIGLKKTYDIEVASTQKFVANGFIVHNSAGMLMYDEADMLSREDINSSLAVTINFPQAAVLMSSTPTGKREVFYETCTTDRFYKDFHFSSHVNPNWNDEVDAFFRSQLTEDGYISEILADFPNLEGGVYKQKFIDTAMANFVYGFFRPNPSWLYTIGVDWNDVKIGTTIAVVGYNPTDGIYYLVDKHIISQAERTQLAACDKIIEINRYWNPIYMYVDAGFGSTQTQLLHDYGFRSIKTHGANSPDAKLRDIVKGYDFGSTVEIYDPFTKQPAKKPSKPFLVDNSVLKFEQHRFRYPRDDEDFTKQLQGYVIDRISVYGRPVYKAKNEEVGDHFLDAVNLALVAFALEKERFSKPKYSADIAITNNFGDKKVEEPKLFKEEAIEHKPKNTRDIRTTNSLLNVINSKKEKPTITTRASIFSKRNSKFHMKPKRNHF